MRDSTYWLELLHFLPGAKIELVFVGPEIAAASHGRVTTHGRGRLTARCFHGTLGDLLRAEMPDFLLGWNTSKFDVPFLQARVRFLAGGLDVRNSQLEEGDRDRQNRRAASGVRSHSDGCDK